MRFEQDDLWGDDAEPGALYLDLWECYLGERHDGHHPDEPSAVERRVAAIESLLVERGLVTTDAIDAVVEHVRARPRPDERCHGRGPGVDRSRPTGTACSTDATRAIGELGFGGAEGENMVVLENTPTVHNVVVCTLCSCYPWPVLGLPPRWYKSAAYRSRVVREPRAVLAEFGTDAARRRGAAGVGLQRRAALPGAARSDRRARKALAEEELAALVTRDHMIGVVR